MLFGELNKSLVFMKLPLGKMLRLINEIKVLNATMKIPANQKWKENWKVLAEPSKSFSTIPGSIMVPVPVAGGLQLT